MIQKILVLTCLMVMMRGDMRILIVRIIEDYLQEMTAGMMSRRTMYFISCIIFRMSVSKGTMNQKSSSWAVAGHTQFNKDSAPPPPGAGGHTRNRLSRQEHLAELRMQLKHMQSKKEELEHYSAN